MTGRTRNYFFAPPLAIMLVPLYGRIYDVHASETNHKCPSFLTRNAAFFFPF